MIRGLVSLEETDVHRDLLSEAAASARGSDAGLVALWHFDADEYDEDVTTLEAVGRIENVEYDRSSIVDGATSNARSFVASVLGDTEVDVRVAVTVGSENDRAEQVLEAADEHDCDHVFIVGDSRSPTGKAVFGDFAQQVVLNFDGYTTVRTE
jgi:nucleotide-binding universal stress UspA family protein